MNVDPDCAPPEAAASAPTKHTPVMELNSGRMPMAVAVHAAEFAFDAGSQGCPVWSLVLNTPLAFPLTLAIVVIAPAGKPAPLPPSVTRYASDSFPAPAHREGSLRQGLRLVSINAAGDFPIRTAASTGQVHGCARTQEQHDRQADDSDRCLHFSGSSECTAYH